MDNLVRIKDIVNCFTNSSKVYLRESEIQQIRKFINSKNQILHITGNPGTGKTASVCSILKNTRFEYINYFSERQIKQKLEKTKSKIVVIDEFDKYFEEKKQECLKILIKLKNNKKIITISNNLRMGNIRFKPYSYSELKQIIELKIEAEIGNKIMDSECINFLAKKYEKTGDLRSVFKAILNAISNMNEVLDRKLTIKDFIETVETNEKGIHRKIISKIKQNELKRTLAYKAYLKECDETGIPCIIKSDFNILFDMS